MPVRVRAVREMEGERAWVLFEDGAPHRPLAVLTDGDMRQAVEDYTAQAGVPAPSVTPPDAAPRGDSPGSGSPTRRCRPRRLWPAGLALLLLAAVALACLAWWRDREPLKDRFLRVRVGMTAAEARAAMGDWGCERREYDQAVSGSSGYAHFLELQWDDGGNYYYVTCSYEDRKVCGLREMPHPPADGLLRRLLRSAGLSR